MRGSWIWWKVYNQHEITTICSISFNIAIINVKYVSNLITADCLLFIKTVLYRRSECPPPESVQDGKVWLWNFALFKGPWAIVLERQQNALVKSFFIFNWRWILYIRVLYVPINKNPKGLRSGYVGPCNWSCVTVH